MKKLIMSVSALASLVMVGCTAPQNAVSQNPAGATATATVSTPQTVNTVVNPNTRVFDCQNGLQVAVKYLNDEQIALSSDNVSAIFKLAPSASGDRYVGNTGLWGNRGGEWHESGNIANFSYKGVHDSQIRQTNCKAQ